MRHDGVREGTTRYLPQIVNLYYRGCDAGKTMMLDSDLMAIAKIQRLWDVDVYTYEQQSGRVMVLYDEE